MSEEPGPGIHQGARPGTGEREAMSRRQVRVVDGEIEVPAVLVGAAAWSWRILVVLGAFGVLGVLVWHLTVLVVPFATALLTTALLMPITGYLRRHGVGRGVSALLTILLALVVIGGVGYFVVNRAVDGYPELSDDASRAVTNIQNYLTGSPFHLPKSSVDNIGTTITNKLKSNQGSITSGVISAGKTAIDVVTGIVLWLFLTIFLVYDGDRVWDWVCRLLPRRGEELARGAGHRAWQTLSGYITGQFKVALFHAVVISATLLILRAPLVAPLALIVFVFSFVPIIGALVAGAFAVVVVLVADGPIQAIVLVGVLIIEDQVESHVLQPLVVGRAVRLHPIAIAVTLTGGALLAGLPGAIFGVPVVACANAAVKFLAGREDIDGHTVPRDEPEPPPEDRPPGPLPASDRATEEPPHDPAQAPTDGVPDGAEQRDPIEEDAR
jgi:predicted PurR-regulated permease PerM